MKETDSKFNSPSPTRKSISKRKMEKALINLNTVKNMGSKKSIEGSSPKIDFDMWKLADSYKLGD